MSALEDLYQEVILDHYRTPRNQQRLESPSHEAEGHNPLCGDRIQVELEIEDGRVRAVGFSGSGCAISTASASMMTEAIEGRSIAEVEELIEDFRRVLTGADEAPEPEALGKLGSLAGVRRIPIRVKCATLAWHTLRTALAGRAKVTTTE